VPSHIENTNGSYTNQKYKLFIDGIIHFHLHATSINVPLYTGPSGALIGGGDWSYVNANDMTDVVITPV
jgi:hypothetical protein